jgi:4Fe-4S binding domain
MHRVRWLLTIGWWVLILSLFYDPISAQLTAPNQTWSPFHPTTDCLFQGQNLVLTAYPMGARIFWSMIIPLVIVTLFVFGHDVWRRICPLSFMSQIPRALGWRRRRRVVNPLTGSVSKELVLVENTWLGRNALSVQMALLFVGLTVRLLLVNSDRQWLGVFLIGTIVSAIVVGYLYGGKSWCHYVCPMAPVQMIYSSPRSVLTAKPNSSSVITQSMCRTVDASGQEESACEGCKTNCLDIDVENTYWQSLHHRDRQVLYYGYVGLVIGFYAYFGLYSGNWNFISCGIWNEIHQLETISSPGFYLFGQAILIPKWIAVPLTLGTCSSMTYLLGRWIENGYTKSKNKGY